MAVEIQFRLFNRFVVTLVSGDLGNFNGETRVELPYYFFYILRFRFDFTIPVPSTNSCIHGQYDIKD